MEAMSEFYEAIERGDAEFVHFILQRKKDVKHLLQSVNDDGWNPLELACYHGRIDIVQIILESIKLFVRPTRHSFLFALGLAMRRQHNSIFYLLLQEDFDLNLTLDDKNEDPVILALRSRNKALFQLLQDVSTKKDFPFLKKLIQKAIRLMALKFRKQCFSWALDEGLIELAEAIAELDRQAIDYVPYKESDLQESIDTEEPDKEPTYSRRALQYLSDIYGFITFRTASRPSWGRTKQRRSHFYDEPYNESDALLNRVAPQQMCKGDTGMHKLIRLRNSAGLRLFLRYNKISDINCVNCLGQTLLHVAVEEQFDEGITELVNQWRVNLCARDSNGDTPLQLAVKQSYLQGIRTLTDSDTTWSRDQLHVLDRNGDSLMHLAVKTGNEEVVATLLNIEANLDLSRKNPSDLTPIEVTDNDAIIDMIVRDKRFVPTSNVILNGKSMLSRLCSINPNTVDIVSKADALFLNPINPESCSCHIEFVEAKRSNNYYLVWCLLKAGPSSIDFGKINFFDALVQGSKHDRELFNRRESFLHVFARTGFDRAIHYFMANKSSLSCKYVEDIFPGFSALNRAIQIIQAEIQINEENPPELFLLDQNLHLYQENIDGNNPIMVSAKHSNCDALKLLLHPLTLLRSAESLSSIVHHQNNRKETLLYLISLHKDTLSQPYSEILHLEESCHQNDKFAIKKCYRESLGSNLLSQHALNPVVITRPAGSAFAFVSNFLGLFLIPVTFFIVDIALDATLVSNYYYTMMWERSINRRFDENCNKLDCFKTEPSGESKFCISVLIMILPFLFYIVEVAKYFQPFSFNKIHPYGMKQAEKNYRLLLLANNEKYHWLFSLLAPLIYIFIWITWPLRVFVMNMYRRIRLESTDTSKEDYWYAKEQSDRYQVLSSRARCIEVSSESSLQPLLQLYLFLPSLIELCSKFSDMRLRELAGSETIQLYKVVFSVLTVSFSFTNYYMKKKIAETRVFSIGAFVYFTSTLCFVVSRLLAFQAFAYFFEAGHFLWPAMAVICHVCLMAVLHFFFTYYNSILRSSKSSLKSYLDVLYDCILNGFANIFVHNKIEMFDKCGYKDKVEKSINLNGKTICTACLPSCFGSRLPTSTLIRQLCFDLIFAGENAVMVGLGSFAKVYKNDLTYKGAYDNGVFIILVLFLLGLGLKVLFYSFCHMWSDLICHCGKSAPVADFQRHQC